MKRIVNGDHADRSLPSTSPLATSRVLKHLRREALIWLPDAVEQESRPLAMGRVPPNGAIRVIAVSQIRFIRVPAVAEARGKAMPEPQGPPSRAKRLGDLPTCRLNAVLKVLAEP